VEHKPSNQERQNTTIEPKLLDSTSVKAGRYHLSWLLQLFNYPNHICWVEKIASMPSLSAAKQTKAFPIFLSPGSYICVVEGNSESDTQPLPSDK